MPDPGDPSRDARRWEDVLDALERAAAVEGEATDAAASAPWIGPADIGPIPPDLVERARTLLARQRETTTRLAARRDSTQRQLAALRGLSPAPAGSVYLDVNG